MYLITCGESCEDLKQKLQRDKQIVYQLLRVVVISGSDADANCEGKDGLGTMNRTKLYCLRRQKQN